MGFNFSGDVLEFGTSDGGGGGGSTPSEKNSKIAVDKATYVSGSDMVVTVTLLDDESKPVTGKASLLTSKTVIVKNANSKSAFVDKKDGTYTATYTAWKEGTNFKAELKLTGWATAIYSAAYGITPGAPSQAESDMNVDSAQYAIGDDIKVYILLRDSAVNDITDQVALITPTAVTIPNAVLKTAWAYSTEAGSYVGIYTAKTISKDNQATFKLPAWSAAINATDKYEIAAGAPDPTKSKIEVDKTEYAAGFDIQVKLTYRDNAGNPITGAIPYIKQAELVVPNSKVKDGKDWVENAGGIYEITYTALKAGTGLLATYKVTGIWTDPIKSATFDIRAAQADPTKSSIVNDKSSYKVNEVIAVTATLKDLYDNPVVGDVNALDAGVKAPTSVTAKDAYFTDNKDGTYTRAYTATTVSTGNVFDMQIQQWPTDVLSTPKFDIVASNEQPDQAQSYINVDRQDLSNPNYIKGDDIKVTVGLFAADKAPVQGQEAELAKSGVVTVGNATLKTAFAMTSPGVYEGVYTAGAWGNSLKAVLKITGWTQDDNSKPYTITSTALDEKISTFKVNRSLYNTQKDTMDYIVVLFGKDGKPATGLSTELYTMATVKNISNESLDNDLPTDVPADAWLESPAGTYTRNIDPPLKCGTGINIVLNFEYPGLSTNLLSTEFSATDGTPDENNCNIGVNSTGYTIGQDILVTVELKDNTLIAIPSDAGLLTEAAVTIPNADVKNAEVWKDVGDGSYTRTYVAKTASTGNVPVLKLDGWTTGIDAPPYDITTTYNSLPPVNDKSRLTTDRQSYSSGMDIVLTLELRDKNGTLVSDDTQNVIDSYTEMHGYNIKTQWYQETPGIYRTVYIAGNPGTGIVPKFKYYNWQYQVDADDISVTLDVPPDAAV